MLINPLIVVRDIHFATSVIVAGIVFFELFIAAPSLQTNLRLPATESCFRERTRSILWISLILSIASALAWLCLVSARIAAKPRATVKTGKEAFYRQLEMPLTEAYDYVSRVMTENMLHAEAEEGIGAFLEKRPPKWE